MRTLTAATGLALLAVLLLVLFPAVAWADHHCSTVNQQFGMNRRGCEDAHHSAAMAVGGAVIAIVASALAGLLSSGVTVASSGVPGGPPPTRTEEAVVLDQDGNPLTVWEPGKFPPGANGLEGLPGQVWDGENWVDPDRMRERIAAQIAIDAQREVEIAARIDLGARMTADSTRGMTAAAQTEAALERAARERNDLYRKTWETIEESAARRGDLGVLLATDSADLFNPDGTLNQELIDRLARATRSGIKREQLAAGADIEAAKVFETPGDEEYGDFTTRAVNNLLTPFTWQMGEWGRNPFIRIGAALATGGTSEIGFQSATALEGIRAAERQAAEMGIDYNGWDAARDGLNTVVDENLPVHTLKKLGEVSDKLASGQDVTLWDVAELVGNVGIDVMNIDTLKALGKSGRALAGGGGWGEVMYSGQGAPSLFGTWEALARTEVRVGEGGLEVGLRQGADDIVVRPPDDPDLRARREAFLAGAENGRRKVDDFRGAYEELEAARSSDDAARVQAAEQNLSRTVGAVQSDKHAMNAIKADPDVGTPFYIERDARIEAPAVENTSQRMAEAFGVPRERIRTFSATNAPGNIDPATIPSSAVPRDPTGFGLARPGDGKVTAGGDPLISEISAPAGTRDINQGIDFDITYQVLDDNGNWVDIDSRFSRPVHNEELWRVTRPTDPIPDQAALQRHADGIDHAVTDHTIGEAYPGGYENLPTTISDPFRHRDMADPRGVAGTAEYKGLEWLNRADDKVDEALSGASPSAAEMNDLLQGSERDRMEAARMLVKQYDNLVAKRTEALARYGDAQGINIPDELRDEAEVLRHIGTNVGGREVTVADAERVLQGMGLGQDSETFRAIARHLGQVVEGQQVLRP